jgi:hypothetical protein
MPSYIHELDGWPRLAWNHERLLSPWPASATTKAA